MPTQIPQGPVLPETGFLRLAQLLTFIPISKSTLARRINEGAFPKPVKLSARVTAWRAEDVRRWILEFGSQDVSPSPPQSEAARKSVRQDRARS